MGKIIKWVSITLLAVIVIYSLNVFFGWGIGKQEDSVITYSVRSDKDIQNIETMTAINGDIDKLTYDHKKSPLDITFAVPSWVVNVNFYSLKVEPSPGSTYIQCIITVDGKVVATETSRNEFAAVTCVGSTF